MRRVLCPRAQNWFVPEGTKLAARLARCLFVKTSRFNEKQYYTLIDFMPRQSGRIDKGGTPRLSLPL